MYTLGITGGMGSGKSTVCRFFEHLGAFIFCADLQARHLMENNTHVRKEVITAFGNESYLSDGHLNRSYLAAMVFGNDIHRTRMNGIVHPRVREAYQEAKQRALEGGFSVLVYEAALIFETGGEKVLDAVAVVDAPEAIRIRRVIDRDGFTEKQIRARMQTQLPAEELRRRADFLIYNTGSMGELRRQTEHLYHLIITERL